jgi:hypothetical protein
MPSPSAKQTSRCSDLTAYLDGNFEPQDRLAVVLINKKAASVMQRLTSAEHIASPAFRRWLQEENALHYDVYVSMNALHPTATGRRKKDVATVRHIYLDFDYEGDAALKALRQRKDLPSPNYVLNTSPNKWQVLWRVHQFEKEQAERLQRGLALQTGADRAATDCARVLRLPYFYNHKYGSPHRVQVEAPSASAGRTYKPDDFPQFSEERAYFPVIPPAGNRRSGGLSQSERDWAFAKRALERGEHPELIIAAIACYRGYDKYDPQYYARLTVEKAAGAVRGQTVLQTPSQDRGR